MAAGWFRGPIIFNDNDAADLGSVGSVTNTVAIWLFGSGLLGLIGLPGAIPNKEHTESPLSV